MAHSATQTGSSVSPRPSPEGFELMDFFDCYCHALTARDLPALVAAWETPAFVLSDLGAHAVGSSEEIKTFFAGAKQQYTARGIVDTRADIVRFEWVSDRIAIVSVRWPLIASSGREIGSEGSTYTLRRDDTGALRIRAVVMHGAMIENPS